MCVLKLGKSNKKIKNIVWRYKKIQLSSRANSRMCNTLYKINIKRDLENKK